MNTIVIIPTYNEAANIEKLIDSISKVISATVLVVDDNSPDGTAAIVQKLCDQTSTIKLLKRPKKLGLASAYIDGLKYALEHKFEHIIQMDCDFSHNPKHLEELLTCSNSYGLVIGSKYTQGGSVEGLTWGRKALSKYGNRYVRTIFRLKYPNFRLYDCTSGYLCWRYSALTKINFSDIISSGYGFLIELKLQAVSHGVSTLEIPITFVDRVAGQSKLSPSIFLETLVLPFKLLRMRDG
jgi:dolichol-phosphate mannosyltransferase